MRANRKDKNRSIKAGRPPLLLKSPSGSPSEPKLNARRKSSKATRTLINKHHQLHKARNLAESSGNHDLVRQLDIDIEKLGGLSAYQAASLTGQDKDRGSDSSEKLVEWLRNRGVLGHSPTSLDKGLDVLEIGALSSKNAISRAIGKGVKSVRRIDLHSQEPDAIEEGDFMDLPIPQAESSKVDVISLSLVLNFVPEPAQRGKMLRRTVRFLRSEELPVNEVESSRIQCLPALFVVLPLQCLSNSRYMSQQHFDNIMGSIGYELLERHNSQKLAYMLYRFDPSPSKANGTMSFKKIELNPGRNRNNFSVVLEAG